MRAALKKPWGVDRPLTFLIAANIGVITLATLWCGERFISLDNLQSMAGQLPELGLIALGVMLAMISGNGGIDLSGIALADLAGVVAALVTQRLSPSNAAPIEYTVSFVLVALAVGMSGGLLNGWLIAKVRLTPILTTLGSQLLFVGVAVVLTNGSAVRLGDIEPLAAIGSKPLWGVPLPFFLFAGVTLSLGWILRRTVYGVQLHLLGTNATAARYTGIPVGLVLVTTYGICGLLASAAGVLIASRTASVKWDYGSSYLLMAILIVVTAGVRPSGGYGRIACLFFSATALQLLSSAFNLAGLSSFAADCAFGLLLLLSIASSRVDFNAGRVRKRFVAAALVLMALTAMSFLYTQRQPRTIATVVKITGINWFNRMEVGVKEFGTKHPGIRTVQTGPGKADPAQQLRVIEDAMARKPDALAVVPLDPAALESVLKRALASGIKVVTHEADSERNTLVDVEAFDGTLYGAHLNDRLAKCMNYAGNWTSFVGSLGSRSHVRWADAGAANAARKYPGMQLVDPKNESNDDAAQAYQKTKEILRKRPDIKGFQGSSSLDVLGIGRAIEEAGLQAKTCVFGTGLPGDAAKFLVSGAVDGVSFWDPKDAGLAMNTIAKLLIERKTITPNMSLGVEGYEHVTVSQGPGIGLIVRGQAWIDVDRTNYSRYMFIDP